jgi:hypothetical protein
MGVIRLSHVDAGSHWHRRVPIQPKMVSAVTLGWPIYNAGRPNNPADSCAAPGVIGINVHRNSVTTAAPRGAQSYGFR